MIVCLCHGVNDRTIRACVEDGADSVKEVGRRCGAGTDCGGCRRSIRQLIRQNGDEAQTLGARACAAARPLCATLARGAASARESAESTCSGTLIPLMASHAG